MQRLFDEKNGLLLLDEIVYQKASFQAIIQDQVVSGQEIIDQANLVISLLKRIETELDEGQKELVIDAIAELAVLYQINTLYKGE